jgi:hypothetical protein
MVINIIFIQAEILSKKFKCLFLSIGLKFSSTWSSKRLCNKAQTRIILFYYLVYDYLFLFYLEFYFILFSLVWNVLPNINRVI